MSKISRRTFFKTATIFSISIIASRYVYAYSPNSKIALGQGSSARALIGSGDVTNYLSDLFGVPVTSSVDAFGNWTISINGGTPIPLTFSLAEVQITATGKVIDSLNANEIYGNSGWAPSGLQNLFTSSGGNSGNIATAPYLSLSSLNSIRSFIASGPDGPSLLDVYGMFVTASGMAVAQATVSANILKLENALQFTKVNWAFAGLDVFGNIVEIATTEQSAAEIWEDTAQIALAIALCFPLSAPLAIGGTILLASWEIWEYKRVH